MHTVPSLVGSGSAVAAAASGLVFGQASESSRPATATAAAAALAAAAAARPYRNGRPISSDHGRQLNDDDIAVAEPPRPSTTSAALSTLADDSILSSSSSQRGLPSRPPLSRYQRLQGLQPASVRLHGSRQTFLRQNDLSAVAIAEVSRESLSSTSSWVKRLSLRPRSQQDSSISSLAADARSLAISQTSATPILPKPVPVAASLAPNKLVKRSPSSSRSPRAWSRDTSRPWSRGHLPALRRPATSHQRSTTLQQLRADFDVAAGEAAPQKYSFEQPIWPEELLSASPLEQVPESAPPPPTWFSYLHARKLTASPNARLAARLANEPSSPTKPRQLTQTCARADQPSKVYLIKASSVTVPFPPRVSSMVPLTAHAGKTRPKSHLGAAAATALDGSPESTPTLTRTRRSLSASFVSAANSWVSKTSGSLRRSKRSSAAAAAAAQPSAPLWPAVDPSRPIFPSAADDRDSSKAKNVYNAAPVISVMQGPTRESSTAGQHAACAMPPTSPLPPPTDPVSGSYSGILPPLRHAPSSGAAAPFEPRPNQPSGSSSSSSALSHLRGSPYDRSSVLESSEGEARGFASGDDDDTDFKSETMFDSLRTLASCRARAVETPLESVYDESPPSTARNGKTKRLSLHELIGGGDCEDGYPIAEDDDEDASTTPPADPVHAAALNQLQLRAPLEDRTAAAALQARPPRLTEELRHLPPDDISDEDWTQDDDAAFDVVQTLPGHGLLSCPSVHPNVQLLEDGGEEEEEGPPPDRSGARPERPRSNLFDWSEKPMYGKTDRGGSPLRPQTTFSKAKLDARGGRSAMRKGPMPAHVRSQSVPIVHGLADQAKKVVSKYGTWSIGAKTVSEDWDEDFEFSIESKESQSRADANKDFAVPESIRASQPSVKAHSGHIRELSLLVNDLKRLCRRGRELDILWGEHEKLWKDAEGIIALASPNEDYMDDTDAANAASDLDEPAAAAAALRDPHRNGSASRSSASSSDLAEGHEPDMSKISVIRERQVHRRRSILSPDDDIFNPEWPSIEERCGSGYASQPHSPSAHSRFNKTTPANTVSVQSVVELMQHYSPIQTPPNSKTNSNPNKVPFDTNSLKTLVRQAGDLRDFLSDVVRRADCLTPSPTRPPRKLRHTNGSPAFTRVFENPASPPRSSVDSYARSPRGDGILPDEPTSSPVSLPTAMMTVG